MDALRVAEDRPPRAAWVYCRPVFRIRRIHDDVLPVNQRALVKAQALLRERFPGAAARTIDHLAEALHDPLAHRLRTVVLVAETRQGLRGCAVLMYAPDLAFCYLDYIATTAADRGRGIGGALFQRAREECLSLQARGLFFECAPDDAGKASTPALTAENAARLRFYETYGARPIANTAYETPMQPGGLDAPHLVFDDLGTGRALGRDELRAIVRAILERKYDWLCPPAYVELVVNSVVDDPVALRAPRYATDPNRARVAGSARRIALVTHDRHEPHHIRERGYVEAPARRGVDWRPWRVASPASTRAPQPRSARASTSCSPSRSSASRRTSSGRCRRPTPSRTSTTASAGSLAA